MWIALQHVVDRLRQPRSRADDLRRVRRRLVAEPAPEHAGADEIEAARELGRLRVAMSEAIGDVESCKGCARGHPAPHGRFAGGHCCGARTEELFTRDELAALRLSGTTPAKLAPPGSDHAGCAFRGSTGCSLAVVDRPNLCVRFVCRELEAELRERGDYPRIKAIGAELRAAFRRFEALRAARDSR